MATRMLSAACLNGRFGYIVFFIVALLILTSKELDFLKKKSSSTELSFTSPSQVHIAITACGRALYGKDALLTIKSIIAEMVPSSGLAHLLISIVWDESKVIDEVLVKPLLLHITKYSYHKFVQIRLVPASELPKELEVPFGKCASQRLFFAENPHFANEDALIYVDTDVLFLKSPLLLWNIFSCFSSLQKFGMANETNGGTGGYYRKRLSKNHVPCSQGSCKCKNGLRCKRFYGLYGLNSGVALMNLTRIRRSDFQSRIRIAMTSFKFYGDQDVYNHLFAERNDVHVLPCIWNIRSDSRCDFAKNDESLGILHGNRKLFHRLEGSLSVQDFNLQKFDVHHQRIRNMKWDKLGPRCLGCFQNTILKQTNVCQCC